MLHPKDPLEKAKGRLRVEKLSKMTSSYYKVLMSKSSEERKEAWKTLMTKLEEIDSELKTLGTPFFGGMTPDMTDYMLWPWNERIPCLVNNSSVK